MIQDPLSQAGIEFRFITCAFNSPFAYLSFVIWYICSVHIYILYMHLCSLWFFASLQLLVHITIYFFPSTWIHSLYCFVDMVTRLQFLHFCKFRSFYFRFSHSFTHAVAWRHTRDIRCVLIMLLNRWPLSSPFHEIPARGGTTYYVPGPSVPSHTVFHGGRPHWDRLNVVH